MFSIQSVFVEGRLNFGRVIVPDLVSSNGVVQVIDTMLIPPTAELGLTIYDRIARTPWLKVHEEILQSSVVPELLFVLPIFGPGLDVLNFFDLVVDVTCVGNKRIFTIEGQR